MSMVISPYRFSAAAPSLAIVQAASGSDQSFNTSQAAVLPSGIVSGSKLVLIFCLGTDQSVTDPAGWTLQATYDPASQQGNIYVYTKTAAGTEGGTTVTATTGGAAKSAWTFWELTTPGGNIEFAGTTTADATPPSLTPTGGSLQRIWLVMTQNIGTVSTGGITAAPSGYTGFSIAQTVTGTNGSNAERTIGGASKIATSSSETPGAFTVVNSSEKLNSVTIAAW